MLPIHRSRRLRDPYRVLSGCLQRVLIRLFDPILFSAPLRYLTRNQFDSAVSASTSALKAKRIPELGFV